MTRGQIRFLVLVFTGLTIWRLMEVPAVNEAFWYFVTAGVVPGTDVVLAADTVIRILLAVFVLTVVILFRKELVNSLPDSWRRQRRSQQSALPAPKQSSTVTIIPRPRMTNDNGRHLSKLIAIVFGYLLYGASVVGTAIEKVLRYIMTKAVHYGQMLYRTAKVAGGALYVAVVKIWYFVEPSLRAFDNWLNVTIHKSKFASDVLDILEACVKEVQARWRSADARTRRLFQDK